MDNFEPNEEDEEAEAEASEKIKFTNKRLCDMTPGLFVVLVEIFFLGFFFTKTYNDYT